MTITPSADSRRVVVAFARLALESFTADHTRENIAALLPLWHGYKIMTDDERADVLAAYPVGDPEPVPGVDYFPEQVAADAAVIVAETLAETDWSLYGPCDYCNVGAGEPCMFVVGARAGRVRVWPHPRRPEVGAQLREFTDAHGCTWRENGDWLTLLDANGQDSGLNKTPAFVEQCYGPLSVVTARPAEVWDDSVPPGGYVCAVCRVPVESEPCPEHGPLSEVTAQPTGEASNVPVMPVFQDPDRICGFIFVGNTGTFKCRRFNHTDNRHWDSIAEVGWADPQAGE